MFTNILIISTLLVFIVVAMKFAHRLYPVEPLRNGARLHVYLDGKHNRQATLTRNLPKAIVIYGSLSLPVHYRGKFYAVGYTQDSHTLIYISRKRLFFFARVAELIRKIVNTPEYDPGIEENTEEKTEPEGNDENKM